LVIGGTTSPARNHPKTTPPPKTTHSRTGAAPESMQEFIKNPKPAAVKKSNEFDWNGMGG